MIMTEIMSNVVQIVYIERSCTLVFISMLPNLKLIKSNILVTLDVLRHINPSGLSRGFIHHHGNVNREVFSWRSVQDSL